MYKVLIFLGVAPVFRAREPQKDIKHYDDLKQKDKWF